MRKLLIIIFFISVTSVRAQIFSVGCNALAIPAMTIQAEGSAAFAKKWSASAEVLIKPLRLSPEFSRIFSSRCIIRRYLHETYTGIFFSASLGYLNYSYDIYEGSGAMISLGAGYSFLLTKRLDLKIEVGATALLTRDYYYTITPGPFEPDLRGTRERTHIVPFPVSLTLSYLF